MTHPRIEDLVATKRSKADFDQAVIEAATDLTVLRATGFCRTTMAAQWLGILRTHILVTLAARLHAVRAQGEPPRWLVDAMAASLKGVVTEASERIQAKKLAANEGEGQMTVERTRKTRGWTPREREVYQAGALIGLMLGTVLAYLFR